MAIPVNESSLASTLPTQLPVTFLKEITSDFSPDRKVGGSIFGTVYKGILPDGSVIAVKKLAENSPVPPGKTLESEVTNLIALHHENIVALKAFCRETSTKLIQHNGRYLLVDVVENVLCYEYLPKGTLNNYIYGETTTVPWETRFKIIKGICQGLHFLHNELDGHLIHMNLVPTSIWLDDKWVPKIGDFGLSRIFGQEQTRMNTINVIGLNGYMSPEYLYRGEISTRLDIYSLGMLILEITTGEKINSDSADRSARQFVDKVYQDWREDGQMIKYKYPLLDADGFQQVTACISIGLQCVEADRNKRPSIVDIVDKLKGKRVVF